MRCGVCQTECESGRFCAQCGASLVAPVGVGSTLGSWKLVAPLATGGMATLFKAEHTRLKRLAAVKVMLPSLAQDADMLARFEREATTLASLRHPHVVSVLDFGEVEGGGLFLVLELIDGLNLRDVIKQGPLPRARAVELARQMLLALEDVHRLSVIHRDLKPSNILVRSLTDGSEMALLADFGIVRKYSDKALTESGLTRTGVVVGTPGYLAPEQILGEVFGAPADLYALGVVLHEMLTGRRLFDGDSIEVMRKHLVQPAPIALPGDDALNAVLARSLDKQPTRRFGSAKEMREALVAAAAAPGAVSPSTRAPRASTSAMSQAVAGNAGASAASGASSPPGAPSGRPSEVHAIIDRWKTADGPTRAALGRQLEARLAEALGQGVSESLLSTFAQVRATGDAALASVTRAVLVERIGAVLRVLGDAKEVDDVLSFVGPEATERLLSSLRSVDNPALAAIVARGLLRVSPRTVVNHLPSLKSVAVGAVVTATAALPFSEARPVLVLAMNHVEITARVAALSCLPHLHALPLANEVRKRLADRDVEVRIAAVRLIEGLEDRLALPALVSRLPRATDAERHALLAAVGVLGGPEAATALRTEFLSEKSLELRCVIADALGKIGDRASLDVLRKEAARLLCPAPLKAVCVRYAR